MFGMLVARKQYGTDQLRTIKQSCFQWLEIFERSREHIEMSESSKGSMIQRS